MESEIKKKNQISKQTQKKKNNKKIMRIKIEIKNQSKFLIYR